MLKLIKPTFCVLTLSISLFMPKANADQSSSAKEVIQKIIHLSKSLGDKSLAAKNKVELEKLVDFKMMTKTVVSGFEEKLNPSQKEQIESLLKKVITKSAYPEAPKFFQDVSIDFTPEDKQGDLVHLKSILTKADRRTTVDYWLASRSDLETPFQVVDVSIEGERWTQNIRDQFEETVNKKGVSGLIEKLKKKVSKSAQ